MSKPQDGPLIDSDDEDAVAVLVEEAAPLDEAPTVDQVPMSAEQLQQATVEELRKIAAAEELSTKGGHGALCKRILEFWKRKWPRKELRVDVVPFHGSMGPIVGKSLPAVALTNPGSLFELLFTPDLLNTIVLETNRYASVKRLQLDQNRDRKAHQPLRRSSTTPIWEHGSELTVSELKLFLGIVFAMGVKRLPEIRDHWSTDEVLADPYISSKISRNRFEEILRYLHVADNSTTLKSKDKLAKVRPMITALNTSFRAVYNPTDEVSIDEGMTPFKGRTTIKQYMKAKPVKWGFRSWNLCDSSFYQVAFDYYAGKQVDVESDFGLAYKVVMQLVDTLAPNRPYRLAINNFYTSVELALALLRRFIYVVGTVRPNRKEFPVDVVNAKLQQRGDWEWRMKEPQLLALKWRDVKEVTLLSTMHAPVAGTVTRRHEVTGKEQRVGAPLAVVDYQRIMQGVDRHDQFSRQYMFDHKSMKWWHPLFFDMLSRVMVNAWLLYRMQQEKKGDGDLISLKEFTLAVIKHLAGDLSTRKRAIQEPAITPQKQFPGDSHWPEKLGQQSSKRCACGCGGRPWFTCSSCKVPLLPTCFKTFHEA